MTLVMNAVGASRVFPRSGDVLSLSNSARICCELFRNVWENKYGDRNRRLECSQTQADCILVLLMNIPGLLVPNT